MKNLISTVFLLVFALKTSIAQDLHLFPQPVSMQKQTGVFTLKNPLAIGYTDPNTEGVARMLVDKLSKPTGFQVSAGLRKLANQSTINLTINKAIDAQLGDE
jgi:hypothetical protein